MKPLSLFVITLVLAFAELLAMAQSPEIIIYGQNTPEWNKNLGVTGTRSSCSAIPDVCMKNISALMAGQHTSRFYLNLPVDAEKAIDYAKYYSKASKDEPRLRELAIDDFPDHFGNWCHSAKTPCDRLLSQIIDNTKSTNPNLNFGVTIYEDQIPSLLANPKLGSNLRSRIDAVHLYMHKRSDGLHFEDYVKQIKGNFPKAQIIAGDYAYDRLDYEKCWGCSAAQARDQEKETLRTQVSLMRQGVIAGIEFYPGYFGLEEKMPQWNNPVECAPTRRQECIDNTKIMHGDTLMILRQLEH